MQSYNELVDNDNDILVHLNKFVNNLKQRMDIVVIRLGYDEEKREIYCNKDLDNEKENEE